MIFYSARLDYFLLVLLHPSDNKVTVNSFFKDNGPEWYITVINALALLKSKILLTSNRIREYAEVFEYFSKIYRNHSHCNFPTPLPLVATSNELFLYVFMVQLAHFVAFPCDIFNICISSNDGAPGIYAS